jgi:hypothetical protein
LESEVVEKLSKREKAYPMTASVFCEARGHVATLIGLQPPGARLKSAFPRVARALGMTERRVKAIWHGEARLIRADEMDLLRAAVAINAKKKATDDTLAHAARLDAAAQALEAVDHDFYREEADRLRNAARDIRRALAGCR